MPKNLGVQVEIQGLLKEKVFLLFLSKSGGGEWDYFLSCSEGPEIHMRRCKNVRFVRALLYSMYSA